MTVPHMSLKTPNSGLRVHLRIEAAQPSSVILEHFLQTQVAYYNTHMACNDAIISTPAKTGSHLVSPSMTHPTCLQEMIRRALTAETDVIIILS